MSTLAEQTLGRLVAGGILTPQQAAAVDDALAAAARAVDPAAATAGATTGVSTASTDTTPSPSAAAPAPRPAGGRTASRPAWTTVVAEVGGYVGGAFVLAAAIVLTGPRWPDFGTAARLAILGVPALALVVAAAAVLATATGGWPVHERRGSGPRRRLASALALVAAALAGGVSVVGVGVGDPWRWDGALWTGTALAVVATAYATCRTPVLHVATAAAAAGLAGFVLDTAVVDQTWSGVWVGAALLGVAAGWLVLTVTGLLDEVALGLTVAGSVAFVGGEVLAVQERYPSAGFLALGALAAAGLVGYVRARHVGVLVVGVVALATVVPQAVLHHTDGALGAAGALLVTGLSILAASVLGLQLRSVTRPDTPRLRT